MARPKNSRLERMKRERARAKRIKKWLKRIKRAIKLARKAVMAVIRSVRRVITIISSIGAPFFLVILGIVATLIIAITVINIGKDIIGFVGIGEDSVESILEAADDQEGLKEEIDELVGSDIAAALDCSSFPPDEREPGENCIEGLLAKLEGKKGQSIPERSLYMVPVWQEAAKKYQVPWMVLAAIEGARTNFGLRNCENSRDGSGVYRIMGVNWNRYAYDGGSVTLRKQGASCYEVITPDMGIKAADGDKDLIKEAKEKYDLILTPGKQVEKLRRDIPFRMKKNPFDIGFSTSSTTATEGGDPTANIFDPVDSAFTQARILAHNGAFRTKKWDYAGSGPGQCSTQESVDGEIWYPNMTESMEGGVGAKYGFNKHLRIPRSAVQLAAKWRSNKGNLKPRRADSSLDQKLKTVVMPEATAKKLLKAAWFAFGVRGAELRRNVNLNYQQIHKETGSGGGVRPYIMQSVHLDWDGNDGNPAGGLFGFIPTSFETAHVDGFNDRFNPLDNILAAVNVQVNGTASPGPILSGISGWGFTLPDNPYESGGKATVVPSGTKGEKIGFRPYRGKPQSDRVSRAVAFRYPGVDHTECYTAVVNAWYEKIRKNPPAGMGPDVSGPVRQRIVKIAQAELKKGVSESGGDNVPKYTKTGKTAVYNISAVWCQAFASRVWYWAGLKKAVNSMGGGMAQMDGKSMPSHVDVPTAWGKTKNLYKTKNPQPGDMAIYGSRHVEIVEKVQSGRVVSTIGGNTSDAVTRVMNPSGITHFVSPPNVGGKGSYSLRGSGGGKVPFRKMAKNLNAAVSVTITDDGKAKTFGAPASSHAWSTIKVAIAAAVIRNENGIRNVSASRRENISKALTRSDNDAAATLYKSLGRKRVKKVDQVLSKAGDTFTSVSRRGYKSFSAYGQTSWGAADANRFFLGLASGKVLNPFSTRFIMSKLERISPGQSWGLGKAGVTAFKGGWGPDRSYGNRYLLRQTGVSGGVAVTVIVIPKSGKFKAGKKAINRVGAWIRSSGLVPVKSDNFKGGGNRARGRTGPLPKNTAGFIAGFEGFSRCIVDDQGHAAIGYGHLLLPGESYTCISKKTGLRILAKDLKKHHRHVKQALPGVKLTPPMLTALISFTYNLGPAKLGRVKSNGMTPSTNIAGLIKRGKYRRAAKQMRVYDGVINGGKRTVLAGLTKRRKAEAAMFMRGTRQLERRNVFAIGFR